MRSGLGRVAGPEAFDELIDGHDASGLEREYGEERARLQPAKPYRVSVLQRLHGPEELELEVRVPGPAGGAHLSRSFGTEPPECPRPGLSIS